MNLITAQQDNPAARLINSREPIVVTMDSLLDAGCLTRYGPIGNPYTTFHCSPKGERVYRPCVHALETPPMQSFFEIERTLQLGWQPRIVTNWDSPTIAARRQDVVTVAFDCMGSVDGCKNHPTLLPDRLRWSYKLFPFVWSDMPDKVNTVCWLGVWND